MTYSIIPPILLILSLIGIILFLMKKAPAVADLGENEERNMSRRPVAFSSSVADVNEKKEGRMKRSFLLTLEKTTRKFKVFFLKMENKFTSWNETIKQKRKSHVENGNVGVGTKEDGVRDVLEKINEYDGTPLPNEVKREGVGSEIRPERWRMEEEKKYRPMISEKVISPQSKKPETKDRLEKILIDRIAINPKDTEAYERLGEYYFEIESYNYAKECFKQVIKLNPGNEDAKNRMRKLERILMR